MKLTKTLEGFKAEVAAGRIDTVTLRKVVAATINRENGWNLTHVSEALDIELVYCDVCGDAEFASKTISAYHGAYWACGTCAANFSICKPCNTYVLNLDLYNPTHRHANFQKPGTLYFPDREHVIAAYNADIMQDAPIKAYFRTPEENQVASHALALGKSASRLRYFGVELEVEKIPGSPPDIIERVVGSLGKKFAILKHDGSLSRRGKGGFEIVTMPATLGYHKGGAWSDFFENLADFFEESPPTTGLHVHVGIATILPITVGRMLMFINSAKNREFICDVARRQLDVANPNGRIYAGVKDDWKASDVLRLKQHSNECPWNPRNKAANNRYALDERGRIKVDPWGNPIIGSIIGSSTNVRRACKCAPGMYNLQKYEALNIMTKRPTVEFRIFRGIVKESFLYMALEFADAVTNFCADASMSNLDYQAFLDWICAGQKKTYRHLFKHLVTLGWIDPPKSYPELEVAAVPYRATLIENG